MKKNKFNKSWKGNKSPKKQRKYIANAPLHIRKSLISVNLSKDLRKKYGTRNVSVRKNDVVKIMRGKYKKKQGKILSVNLKKMNVVVENIQVKKMDGSKVNIALKPSNLQIIELNTDDKKRLESPQLKTKEKVVKE